MRILVVGAGDVGAAAAAIARRRDFFEHLVLADLDGDRAGRAAAATEALARAERADTILLACDPRLNPPIFAAARAAARSTRSRCATARTSPSTATPSPPRSRSGPRSRSA